MKQFSYLFIEFFTVIICFLKSFDEKIRFDSHFRALLKAASIVAIPFIAWDIFFTARGVWWFNDEYITGIKFFGLPVEEYLFFVCIPFSCVFTYFCFEKFFTLDLADAFGNIIVFVSVVVCVVVALHFHNKAYTLSTALCTAGTLIYLHFMARVSWIGSASFVFLILMFGFFPVNGMLTGSFLASPIVNYHEGEILGIRIFTIPIEDLAYGYTHFVLVLHLFKIFQKESYKLVV